MDHHTTEYRVGRRQRPPAARPDQKQLTGLAGDVNNNGGKTVPVLRDPQPDHVTDGDSSGPGDNMEI